MSNGFYLMHRGWMENPAFKESQFCDRMAWIWLIEQACYEPHQTRKGYELITVGRGQVPITFRLLQQAWGWGMNRITGTLNLWKTSGMIEVKTERGLTVITICNYDKYQSRPKESGTQTGTQVDTQTERKRERPIYKEVKEVKEVKEKKVVGTRFALQDPPSDWINFCLTQRPDLEPGRTFDGFRDYWTALPGAKALKTDWTATWRNWVRNQKPTNGVNGHGQRQSKLSIAAEGIARAAAKRQSGSSGIFG